MKTKKLTANDCLCERNSNGGIVMSAIFDGHRMHRVYYGYSEKYAKKDFCKNPPL